MTDPRRNAELAKIHIAKKDLRLSDDAYEAAVMGVSGGQKTSAGKLTSAERAALLDRFRALGFKTKRATGARAEALDARQAKIKALWRALWNLGVVRDPSEAALLAFVERQTGGVGGVKALRFLDARAAGKVIEGLKAMAGRPIESGGAGVDWEKHANPRVAVLGAQWRRLASLGAVNLTGSDGLRHWLAVADDAALAGLPPGELDDAADRLGEWIRRELTRKGVAR